MRVLKGEGPVPVVCGNEAPEIVGTGKRDNGLFSLQSPSSQAPLYDEFASSAVVAGVAVKLPDKCKCGGAISLICSGSGQNLAESRCESCHALRGRISHRAYSFIAQIVAKFCRRTAPIIIRRGGKSSIRVQSPRACWLRLPNSDRF
jgi:hypothetical protein